MSRNCGVQHETVLAGDPLAVERRRLADEPAGGAELDERRPVGRDLERRGEPGVPRVGDVGGDAADQPGVVGEQAGEPGSGGHGLAGGGEVEAEAAVEARVDGQQRDVADRVDLVDHHHPPFAHRLQRTPSRRAAPVPASSAAGTNSWRNRYSSLEGPPLISTNP